MRAIMITILGSVVGSLACLALATSFVIVEPSEAGYRVRERLGGVPFPSDTTGGTSALRGRFEFAADGTLAEGSLATVELATLVSSQPRRDAYVREVVFDTDRFPEAVFRPTRVRGVPWPPPEQGAFDVAIDGELILREHAFPVTWQGGIEFDAQGAFLEVATRFSFDEADLIAPRLGVFVTVEDEITLEARLRLERR